MYAICNLGLIQNDAARGNSPLWFGEWSLATNFDADDAFLRRWADAQKLTFSKSQGWIVRLSFPSPQDRQTNHDAGDSSGTSRWRSRPFRGSGSGRTWTA